MSSQPTIDRLFDERLSAAFRMLAETKIWRSSYAPPIYRGLWKLGVALPPPHFRTFWPNMAFNASWFGPSWGVCMWIGWWHAEKSGMEAVVAAALAGIFFGVTTAFYYRYGQSKYGLPSWESLAEIDAAMDAGESPGER